MEPLDPDDPRPPFQQVANSLRAAIRTRKFEPGEQLPSLNELSKTYSVSLMTVQKALGLLRTEGLIISRQGKGSFVRQRTERPVGLRPHVERAFDRQRVSIDFAGFSAETLHGAIAEPLDKIRSGRLTPEEISVRILLPDLSVPVGVPSLAADGSDSLAVRARSEKIARRSTSAVVDAVRELEELQLVKSAAAVVRVHRTSPAFKLIVLNDDEAFFGFYPVIEHTVMIGDSPTPIYDAMGKDAELFHLDAGDEDSIGPLYVAQANRWFDSVWNTVARNFTP